MRVMYFGNPGTGKTKHLCMDVCHCMLNTCNSSALYDSYEMINYFNSLGFKFETNYEHLGFCNLDINTSGLPIPDLKSYVVNPFKLGIKSNDFETDILPYAPNIFITELQIYFPSDMWDCLRPDVKKYWQTSRQYDINLVGDCQRPLDVAKPIRELFDIFIEFIKVEDVLRNGKLVHKWTLRKIEGNRNLEEYLRTNNKNLCVEYVEYSDYFYNSNYDSYFCRLLHIKGREKQKLFVKHFDEINSEELFIPPNGYFVMKNEKYKQDKKEEIFND